VEIPIYRGAPLPLYFVPYYLRAYLIIRVNPR